MKTRFFIVTIIMAVLGIHAQTPLIFTNDTVISTDIEVPVGMTIRINPGVTIRFEGYRTFLVKGVLLAEGTGDKPILFTAIDRDRGSRETPSWKGFEIVGKDAQAVFRNCRIEGAFRNLVWECSPLFDSCEFVGNHYGIYCTRKASPHVENSKFYRNTFGIAADYASPLLLDNLITNNTVGLYLQLSSKVVTGKNIIKDNVTNIKSEESMGANNCTFSLQYLWNVMQQLY